MPMLEAHDLIGLVEPLGFEACALRYKEEAVEAIESLGATARFKLVHDTFHHTLAGGGPIFADHTGIVHISGVTDPSLAVSEMRDKHRVLVTRNDRLGNIEQTAGSDPRGLFRPSVIRAVFTRSSCFHRSAGPACRVIRLHRNPAGRNGGMRNGRDE